MSEQQQREEGASNRIEFWLLRITFWLATATAPVEFVRDGYSLAFGHSLSVIAMSAIGLRYYRSWRESLTAVPPIPDGIIRVTVDGRSCDIPPRVEDIDAVASLVEFIREARR